MRKCAPGGGEALNWSQNSGGWSRTSHPPSSAARREHPLLGAGGLLVAADAGDQAVEAVFGQRQLQPFGLARGGARGRRQGRIDGVDRRAGLDLQVEAPIPWHSGRGRRTSPEISCRCRHAWPGTARGRRRPCAPARSSRWNPCPATTAAPASSAARRPRAGCRCSAPRARRGDPSRRRRSSQHLRHGRCLARVEGKLSCGFRVEKMHLSALTSGAENSKAAALHREEINFSLRRLQDT